MIQIVQLHGTDKKLYELVAPLVMSPEVLKQNYNYPFRTSEEYEWFVALDNKHVVGFVCRWSTRSMNVSSTTIILRKGMLTR